jgi:ATP-binding cassette subfamily B protein
LDEIFRRKDENSTSIAEQSVNEGITLQNVSFKYEGSFSPLVLNDINLHIPKGKILAIVGSSGSGKTTLMKLLLSFYAPTRGKICLDSTDMLCCNTDIWRQHCGVVMQDGYIYSGTVAQNIALSQANPDYNSVQEAAKIACVDDFIKTLPRGYNTRIGNNGVGLSGGQKQRILIARSIYKNPEFLFFDEATSSLDASNEKRIMDNLYSFYKNRTIIIIAHRLSTVKNADHIIFMDKGRIVEQGSHKQLIQNKGAYYTLVKDQLELEG